MLLILGCYGSSDFTTILLEIPFKANQGQVSDRNVFTDHKITAISPKKRKKILEP